MDLRDRWCAAIERAEHPRTPEVGLYICMQICHGLHYAHNYGNLHLVHRDICPSNVLISYFGEVKVTDFGLAKSMIKQELTQPGKIFGSFSYLSPEQVAAQGGRRCARTSTPPGSSSGSCSSGSRCGRGPTRTPRWPCSGSARATSPSPRRHNNADAARRWTRS